VTVSQTRSTLGVMSTIELPDDVGAALAAAAAERGTAEAELIAEFVADAEPDGLDAFIGVGASGRTDPFDIHAERSTEAAKRRSLSFVAAGHSGSNRGGAEAEELLEEDGFGIDTADR